MKRVVSVSLIGVFVFGFALASFAADAPITVPSIAPLVQAPVTSPAPAAAPVVSVNKAGFFVEGGLAGGAGAVELGYGRTVNDKLSLSGAVGYSVGNGYGVTVLDPIGLVYNLGAFTLGAGLNYAMYSSIVTNIPGLSGNIANQNMFGIELSAGKNFGKVAGKLGYSTALGLRAGLIYNL